MLCDRFQKRLRGFGICTREYRVKRNYAGAQTEASRMIRAASNIRIRAWKEFLNLPGRYSSEQSSARPAEPSRWQSPSQTLTKPLKFLHLKRVAETQDDNNGAHKKGKVRWPRPRPPGLISGLNGHDAPPAGLPTRRSARPSRHNFATEIRYPAPHRRPAPCGFRPSNNRLFAAHPRIEPFANLSRLLSQDLLIQGRALHGCDKFLNFVKAGPVALEKKDPKLKRISAFVPIPNRRWSRNFPFIPLRQANDLWSPTIRKSRAFFREWKNQRHAFSARVQVHNQFFVWPGRRGIGKRGFIRFSINRVEQMRA